MGLIASLMGILLLVMVMALYVVVDNSATEKGLTWMQAFDRVLREVMKRKGL